MKNIVLTSILVIFLAACAITSSYGNGPNGRPVHYIDAISASAAFEKASELCVSGYTFVMTPQQRTPLDYIMTIECK